MMTFIRTLLGSNEPLVEITEDEITPDTRTLVEKQAESVNLHLSRLRTQLLDTDDRIRELINRRHQLKISIRAFEAAASVLHETVQ